MGEGEGWGGEGGGGMAKWEKHRCICLTSVRE